MITSNTKIICDDSPKKEKSQKMRNSVMKVLVHTVC